MPLNPTHWSFKFKLFTTPSSFLCVFFATVHKTGLGWIEETPLGSNPHCYLCVLYVTVEEEHVCRAETWHRVIVWLLQSLCPWPRAGQLPVTADQRLKYFKPPPHSMNQHLTSRLLKSQSKWKSKSHTIRERGREGDHAPNRRGNLINYLASTFSFLSIWRNVLESKHSSIKVKVSWCDR